MMVIVNPPNPPGAVSNKDTMGGLGQLYPSGAKIKMPPLDIPYAAAVLKERGIRFQVMECLAYDWDLNELIVHLKEKKPEVIAIRTSLPTFDWDMQVAQSIKMVGDLKILVFGPYASLFPEQALNKPFVDAIVVGEPEMALAEIAEREDFSGCEGIWYKQGGKVIQNRARKPIDDLGKLPFPAWDSMPYQAYDGGQLMHNLKPFVTALTSRGCPYGCSYCPYPVTQGRKLRVRSPENVVDELEWLADGLGVKAVLFRDPEFALHRDRTVSICEGILKRGVHLSWRCETRIGDLNEELVTLMAKAGCIGINMGVESADEGVLRNMGRKPVPLESARRIVKACKKNGIDAFCFFIIGLPGETKSSALNSINYALKLNPTFVQFTMATPYPGTELRKWAENKGFLEKDSLSALTSYEAVMRNEHMTIDEIQKLRWFAHEAWEMQSRRMIRRILENTEKTTDELKRWLCFQRAKFKMIT